MEITIRVPSIRELAAHWRWVLLMALVLAFTMAGGAGPAAAAGNSITSPDTAAGNVGQFSSMALDGSGNPVVSYYDPTNTDLKVLHCNDANCAGGDDSITSPDTAGSVGQYTSLALDGAGYPVVSYFSNTNGDGDLKVLHCNDANCSGGGDSITSPDTVGIVGYWTSLALDANGYPVVSYYDVNNLRLKLLHCNDANCAGGDESIGSPYNGQGGEDTSLALDASGNPVVSYFDYFNGADLKVLHCNDANCAGGDDSVATPDETGLAGRGTSLTLDGSGNPVISYQAAAGLKVLHCGDANCVFGNTISNPDGSVDVGNTTSLALDANGYPVVSYREDDLSYDLRLLHCNDPDCAGGDDSITSPDTDGDVGIQSSLALDGLGDPVVSYYTSANDGDLKLLHCSDPNCTGSKVLPSINITNLGQYALPKTCFQVENGLDFTPLFHVCDNGFQGAPEANSVCAGDGVCNDENPADGAVVVTVLPGNYVIAEGKPPPQHSPPVAAQPCNAASGPCALTFINTPYTRPWFPWDLAGGPGGTADGKVTTVDILSVIRHYGQQKPPP